MQLTPRSTSRAAALASAALALVAVPLSALASSNQTPLSVTAVVSASCSLATSTLAFGPYAPGAGTALNGQGTVTVTCTKGTPMISIGMNHGANAGTGTQRNMIDGATPADDLAYNLFQPTAGSGPNPTYSCIFPGTTAWGDGTSGTTGSVFVPVNLSPGPSPGLTYPVCGTIPASQNVPAGNYSDTVQAIVNF